MTLEGEVHRSLQITTGAGTDTLTIASSAKVSKDAMLKLGAGDDTVSHAGTVSRKLHVDGGDGTDTYADLGGTAKELKLNSIESSGVSRLPAKPATGHAPQLPLPSGEHLPRDDSRRQLRCSRDRCVGATHPANPE